MFLKKSETFFCFRTYVSCARKRGNIIFGKHASARMFLQQCFLVCNGLNVPLQFFFGPVWSTAVDHTGPSCKHGSFFFIGRLFFGGGLGQGGVVRKLHFIFPLPVHYIYNKFMLNCPKDY